MRENCFGALTPALTSTKRKLFVPTGPLSIHTYYLTLHWQQTKPASSNSQKWADGGRSVRIAFTIFSTLGFRSIRRYEEFYLAYIAGSKEGTDLGFSFFSPLGLVNIQPRKSVVLL